MALSTKSRLAELSIVSTLMLLGGGGLADETKTYPDLKGSRHDSNGDIEWLSQGLAESGTWTYSYSVKNAGKINCRVGWDAFSLLTTILPDDVARGSFTGPDELRQVDGKLTYNGGAAAGDATAPAAAWVANDRKPGKSSAKAAICVQHRDALYPIEIIADSEVRFDENSNSYKIAYELSIAPEKKVKSGAGVSSDMKSFKDNVGVKWESIASNHWSNNEAAKFEFGEVKETGDVLFQRRDASVDDSPLMMRAVTKAGRSEPILRQKAIVFTVFGKDGSE